MCKAVLSVRGTTSIWKFGNECGILEQLHQLMQILLLFCTKKAIFSILRTYFYKTPYQFIYSPRLFNKIFIFYNFLLFSLPYRFSLTDPIWNPSPSPPLSLSQTQSTSRSLSHQPNNNYNPPFHNKITTKHPNDAME